MSSLFLRTLRENPADAEVPSHQLLVRAGYIRRVSPGIYTWLPLGLKVLKRVEQIVREEMDAIGSQELLFPALLPREPYEASGRWTEYGDNVFRLKDRKGTTTSSARPTRRCSPSPSRTCTPPTRTCRSRSTRSRQVPRRGAAARRHPAWPRVRHEGLLLLRPRRGRAARVLRPHRDAYIKIFDRLGFHYVIVQAMAGAMGGSKSRSSSPPPRTARTPTSAVRTVGMPRTSRPCRSPPPTPIVWGCPPRTSRTRPTLPPSKPWSTANEFSHPREDRPGRPADTLKNVVVMLVHPDGTASRSSSACPVTVRSTRSAWVHRWSRRSSRPSRRPTSRHTRRWKGYIGPGGARRGQ
jgi:prolyl-tRNA synthetase